MSRLFGLEELCGRVLVRDAELIDPEDYRLARGEHHAEDEFTAGVFAGSKFDRTALIAGSLRFEVVVEAESNTDLDQAARVLLPALELARLGHLPIGGSKWRGAGWVRWAIEPMTLGPVGATPNAENPAGAAPLGTRWEALRTTLSGPAPSEETRA